VTELGAAAQLERDPLGHDRLAKRLQAGGKLADVRDEVTPHVRGDDHRAGAGGSRRGRQLERVGDRRRAVVDAGEQVEVEVGVHDLRSSLGASGERRVTMM
jgi:hypothetical protein